MVNWYSAMPGVGTGETAPERNWWQQTAGGVPAPWTGLEDLARTTVGRPSELWQSGALGRMSATQAANPYWAQTAMQGFTPTYGSYLLGGGQGAFGDWLGQTANMPGAGYGTGQNTNPTGWANAMAASQALATGATPDTAQAGALLNPTQISMMGLLSGENARTNALAMAQAQMGGGIGMGAMARERALGRLYDVYGARARSATQAPGGFLNWLGGRMAPTG
jgi:hypothetical protein